MELITITRACLAASLLAYAAIAVVLAIADAPPAQEFRPLDRLLCLGMAVTCGVAGGYFGGTL